MSATPLPSQLQQILEDKSMTTLKIHYEGWISLPTGLRQKLGLSSGDRLEAQLVNGAIVLRPAANAQRSDEPATVAPLAPLLPDVAPARRKPGRPRKTPMAEPPEAVAEPKRPRGRPRRVAITPEPEPAPAVNEPWKLRKKADRPAAKASDELFAAPAPACRPARASSDTGHEREERRPFRNVEVRKLGPGRGYTKPRRLRAGPAGPIA